MGAGEPGSLFPHSGVAEQENADRCQRQHRAGPWHHGLRHGRVCHVPDHTGNVRRPLLERNLRACRRHRASGRGRDRRMRLRHRGVLRGQVCGNHHLGTRHGSQAGAHRLCRHGRDPPGYRQRPARRTEHRATHQGGAGRSPAGDLRRSRRFAKGRHGGGHHRGVLLPGDGGTQNRRDIQSARRASERRQFGHSAAAICQAQAQQRVVRSCLRPDRCRRRRAALRVGRKDGNAPALHSGTARWHAHGDRTGARPRE